MQKYAKERRDQFYKLAKEDGYRARSAYKLLQIDDYLHILDGVERAVDLCAAPGSWSQVLSARLPPSAHIVAVDLAAIAPIPNVKLIQGDITTELTANQVIAAANGLADLVVCDGAPDVTGIHDLDEFVQAELIQAAFLISDRILRTGGSFVAKVFRGQLTETILVERLSQFFKKVQIVKPAASRSSSMEAFVVGQGFKEGPGEIVQGVACIGRGGIDSDKTY
ncbi:FtsJ-like_methyltransferase [Hexamita inflata]|uniref:FtsJ-like methyltransferase n=1 Tax=Hexamita inflata TaxID=28002 RepID=A0AA86NI55_9EUKA|nr:FtsJ-like methyltransferase [Hexamita inflata]